MVRTQFEQVDDSKILLLISVLEYLGVREVLCPPNFDVSSLIKLLSELESEKEARNL